MICYYIAYENIIVSIIYSDTRDIVINNIRNKLIIVGCGSINSYNIVEYFIVLKNTTCSEVQTNT